MWHPVRQNTEEPCPCCGKTWPELRAGRVTGSSIGKVMAYYDKPLKSGLPQFGDPAKHMAVEIAVVELGGKPTDNNYSNNHMERGHEQEPIARALYEKETFSTVTNGGFYDNGRTGCSPDGIIGNGIPEIKSVINHVHHATIKRNEFDPAYKWQVPFNLMESKLDWIDYISFCSTYVPGKELFIKRYTKEELGETFKIIQLRLVDFFRMVDEIKKDMLRS